MIERADVPVADRAVLDALPRAIVVTSPEGRILLWNRRADELYGWKASDVVGRAVNEVLAPLSERAAATALLDVVASGQIWEGDFTVLRSDGEPVRVWVSGRPILDDDGLAVASVWAAEDVTDQRLLEQRAADLTERLQLALDAGGLGTFRWDLATGATTWDARLEALFGLEPGTFDGTFDTWVSLLHPDDRAGVLQAVERAVEKRGRYTVEHRVVWPDGSVHWLEGSGQVTLDAVGQVTGTIGCTRDVTDVVIGEQERQRLTLEALEAAEQERVNRERLEVLGSINDALAVSRDRRQLMANVVRAAVPRLGDWCSIYVFADEDTRVPEVETAHVDPEMVAYARKLQAQFPYDPDAPTGMPAVIRTGTPEIHRDIDAAVMADLSVTGEARDIVQRLALRSAIAVPITKRGRTLGGLQLIMTESRRRYSDDDLALAEAVAARIAASLDNLRLSELNRSIAITLQEGLLPEELPDIPGVELAVRYWAHGEGVEVGGDFYDLFELADDRWAVVIGDVCGKGPGAAAVTGLARHTIASSAWHGDDHEQVLRSLNRTMRSRRSRAFCTALYGTVQRRPSGVELTFACGGHPLPLLARPGCPTLAVGSHGSLIGVLEDIEVTTTTVTLVPGDTVVLYTDGATDVSPPHGLTDAALAELVEGAAAETASADALADHLHVELSRILGITERSDDIALLILRLPPA